MNLKEAALLNALKDPRIKAKLDELGEEEFNRRFEQAYKICLERAEPLEVDVVGNNLRRISGAFTRIGNKFNRWLKT